MTREIEAAVYATSPDQLMAAVRAIANVLTVPEAGTIAVAPSGEARVYGSFQLTRRDGSAPPADWFPIPHDLPHRTEAVLSGDYDVWAYFAVPPSGSTTRRSGVQCDAYTSRGGASPSLRLSRRARAPRNTPP